MDETFKALSDPVRREILLLLGERDMPAGQIASHFSISAPSVSHHLRTLDSAGLVTRRRNGQNIVYSLNAGAIQELIRWFYTAFGNIWQRT